MKIWVVFCCVVLAKAEPPRRGAYGAPAATPLMGGGYLQDASVSSGGGYSGGSSGGIGGTSSSAHLNGGSSEGGQVRRYVSIHVAPDEPESNQNRIIRVPGNKDKHVNIIFVKAPSMSSAQNTEVILPEQPEHKTLVYVLVKKSEGASDIKIRAPQATRPPKPEVFHPVQEWRRSSRNRQQRWREWGLWRQFFCPETKWGISSPMRRWIYVKKGETFFAAARIILS